ncbi:DNA repair Mms21 [Tubulinosema ratisbonensis]|uniref:DNA repair Mms21 n=1 Tax=Tubulinosema ratisbonensis TaxID=291195 RepID=A0A437AP99_9MICR|nr:DNA repair Mms21 [Tubulinosema ratisbonensis]
MTVEKECIAERIKVIEETIKILEKSKEECLDTIENLLLHKVILKRREWNTKPNFMDAAKKSGEYLREISYLLKVEAGAMAKNANQVVCPITKRPIVDVYKAPCGHEMEKSAAITLIRQGFRGALCPVIGCKQILPNIKN